MKKIILEKVRLQKIDFAKEVFEEALKLHDSYGLSEQKSIDYNNLLGFAFKNILDKYGEVQ